MWRERSWLLGNNKGAVTTAVHSHSTRQRLIGVKKDRALPQPLATLPPQVSFPRCPAPTRTKKVSLFSFIVLGITSPKARLQPRPQLSKSVVTTTRPTLSALRKLRALALLVIRSLVPQPREH